MKPSICEECDKESRMFEDDGTGYCYEHAIEYAQEEFEREQEEEGTGIAEYEIAFRAREKMITFAQAKEELIKERKRGE